jgi:hypothetical protein
MKVATTASSIAVESKANNMNSPRWTRAYRSGFFATIIFGACIGVVFGIRRVDPVLNQDLYWLWLGLWVASGAMLAAIGAYIRQSLRRS